MILFGLPESREDDAGRAARCAIELCNQVERWIASLPPAIASRTGFKVGAHFGRVVASRLGGSYQHVTATGDIVNVASRLMEVAARQGAALALSDDLLRKAGPNCALFESGTLTGQRKPASAAGPARFRSGCGGRCDSCGHDESGLLR